MGAYYKNGRYLGDSTESAIQAMFHDPNTLESLRRVLLFASGLKRWTPGDISYEMPWMDAVTVIEDVLYLIKIIGLEGYEFQRCE